MGEKFTQVTSNRIKIGVSQYSPLDVDSYIDKSLVRTLDPKDPNAHVLYTKKPVETGIPIQIVFNDYEFLKKWKIEISDLEEGKRIKLSNSFVDGLISRGAK